MHSLLFDAISRCDRNRKALTEIIRDERSHPFMDL